MRTLYWVGGTATWDATAGTKWALTSGGAGGQAIPTLIDDVFIDNFGGNIKITCSGSPTCRTLDFNNGTGGAFIGEYYPPNVGTSVYGSLIFSPSMTINHGGASFNMLATSAGWVIQCNGNNTKLSYGYLSVSGTGGGWTVSDNYFNINPNGYISKSGTGTLTFAANITIGAGSYSTNISHTAGTLTFADGSTNVVGYIASTGNTARTISFGSSAWTFSHYSGNMQFTGSNLTFNCGTTSWIFTGANPTLAYNAGLTFYDIEIKGTAATYTFSGGSFTCHNLKVTPTTTKALAINAGATVTVTGVCQYNGSSWVPFALPAGIAITSPTIDTHAPSNFTTPITLSCTTGSAADNVYAQINDKVIALVNVGGNNWSVTIYAGYFGACTSQTVYFTCRTDAENYGLETDPSTITIPAITTKTATLLTQIAADLAAHSVSGTVTLIGEEEVGATILSLIKIVVATYSVATIDAIRTVVAAHVAGWSGSVSSVEYSAPVNASSSIVIYKMIHS